MILDTNALSAFADGEQELLRLLKQEEEHQLPGDSHFDCVAGLQRVAW